MQGNTEEEVNQAIQPSPLQSGAGKKDGLHNK